MTSRLLTSRYLNTLFVPMILILLLMFVWVGFGVQRVGLYEEWAILSTMDETAPILVNMGWNNISGYDLEHHYTRPLSMLPNTLAFMLTPNSFLGHHILLFLMLFGCGYFFYLLVRRLLPGRREIALLAAMLCMLPIADTGYMNFRLLVVVFVSLCWVAATWLLVVFYQSKRKLALVLMYLPLCAGLLAYEAAYPLVFLTPVLLVWLARGINRRVILSSILWYIGPLVVLARTLIVIAGNQSSYIGGLISENVNRDLKTILTIIWYSFWRLYQRSFLGAWVEGFSKVLISPYAIFAILMAVLGGIAIFVLLWTKRRNALEQAIPQEQLGIWRWLALLAISIGSIMVGFGLFMPVESYSVITDRVYMLTGFGTALSIAMVVYLLSQWIGRRTKPQIGTILFSGIASALMLATAMQVIDQTRAYNELSLVLQRFLGQMAALAPRFKPDTQIMVIDDTGSLNGEQFMGQEGYLTRFVRVIYQDKTLFASICSPLKQYGAPMGTCSFKQDTFGIEGESTIDQFMNVWHDNQYLVLFRYTPDRNLKLLTEIPLELRQDTVAINYHPQERILSALPTDRIRGMLACFPIEPCTEVITPHPVDYFYTDYSFRDELMRHGLGWFKTETRVIGGATLAWNSAYRSVLDLRLKPEHKEYILTARILFSKLPDITKDMTMKVNGVPVTLEWTTASDGTFTLRGVIPRALIEQNPANTRIEFEYSSLDAINANKPAIKGSVAFDYLKIEGKN